MDNTPTVRPMLLQAQMPLSQPSILILWRELHKYIEREERVVTVIDKLFYCGMRNKYIIIAVSLLIVALSGIITLFVSENKNADGEVSSSEASTERLKLNWAHGEWLQNIDRNKIKRIVFKKDFQPSKSSYVWEIEDVCFDLNDSTLNIVCVNNIVVNGSVEMAFSNLMYLSEIVGLENIDFSRVTNIEGLFKGCFSLKSVDFSNCNFSNAKSFNCLFENCSSLQEITFPEETLYNIESIDSMFKGCIRLETIKLPLMPNVNSAVGAFSGVGRGTANGSKIVGTLEMANCKDMSNMFMGATLDSYQIIEAFNTSSLQKADKMLANSNVNTINLSMWNAQNIQTASGMFSNCAKLKYCTLDGWNVENLEDCSALFESAVLLDAPILNWQNVESLKDVSRMFFRCSSLTLLDIDCFKNKTFQNANEMFAEDPFLTTIKCFGFSANAGRDMFKGCFLLSGEMDYNPEKTGINMANCGCYFV